MAVAEWIAFFTCIAAWFYTIFFLYSLFYVRGQLKEQTKSRLLHTSLSVFDILQTPQARKARKYIHDHIPTVRITKLTVEEIEKHLEGIFDAMAAFGRVGFFLVKGYIHPDEVVPIFWAIVWRCWKKSEKLIRLMRKKRRDPSYRVGFEYFFKICEAYREEHGYKKPRFY